jgi:hypothetical protein
MAPRSLINTPVLLVILTHSFNHQANVLSINVQKIAPDGVMLAGVDVDGITAEEFGVPEGSRFADYITCDRLCAFVASLEGAVPAVMVSAPDIEERLKDPAAVELAVAETVAVASPAAATMATTEASES